MTTACEQENLCLLRTSHWTPDTSWKYAMRAPALYVGFGKTLKSQLNNYAICRQTVIHDRKLKQFSKFPETHVAYYYRDKAF